MIGTVGLYLYLQKSKAEKWAFAGLLLTLTHQMLGIGVFAVAYFLFPAAGHLFLAGVPNAISYAAMDGALAGLFGISLICTMAGLFCMALAIQKSGKLPKWTGWVALLGFALIPVPGVVIQFLANTIWGAAYFRMAVHVSRTVDVQKETLVNI